MNSSPPSGPEDSLQELGREFLNVAAGLVGSLGLYDPGNDAVKRQADALLRLAHHAGSLDHEELRLQRQGDDWFINRRLVKVDRLLYERGRQLADVLARMEVGELLIRRTLKDTDLTEFLAELSVCLRTRGRKLTGARGGIEVGNSDGRAVASYKVEPEQHALEMVSGLQDLVEALYTRHARGEAPSLAPLRRALQLIADDMGRHSGIYQFVAASHDPETEPSAARYRVAVALDAVGFGVYLELPKKHLLMLGLSSVLVGLGGTTGAEGSLRPLFRYRGLGDLGMPVALALFDARAPQDGASIGVSGRLLTVVEAYHALTTRVGERAPYPPAAVLSALSAGRVEGVDPELATAFLAYKGRWPLGSAVTLSDGRLAVVISRSEVDQGARPVVRVVEDGRLGERIDLQDHGDLSVQRAAPSLSLAQLTSDDAPSH